MQHTSQLRQMLREAGWPIIDSAVATPIIPLIAGDEQAALNLQAGLLDVGIFAPAIRPPTVAPGQCRVRLSLRADHTSGDIDRISNSID